MSRLMRDLALSGLSPLSVATLAVLDVVGRPEGATEAAIRARVAGEAADLVPVALECLSTAGEIFSVRLDAAGELGPSVWRLATRQEAS
jgi:hypothetical protein